MCTENQTMETLHNSCVSDMPIAPVAEFELVTPIVPGIPPPSSLTAVKSVRLLKNTKDMYGLPANQLYPYYCIK